MEYFTIKLICKPDQEKLTAIQVRELLESIDQISFIDSKESTDLGLANSPLTEIALMTYSKEDNEYYDVENKEDIVSMIEIQHLSCFLPNGHKNAKTLSTQINHRLLWKLEDEITKA
ncbi:hypothetical protein PQO01_19565 [Lentisphaera marina]|uniref:hypothetical protein n=1 Tax=Lentisphaera marina TaxID=1111041 RepID=UPI002366D7F8|nr:hypothetical protein [Lentisphaera marina]MDD7987155.1 hypothetical protein [Lentisphaera marina]